MMQHGGKNSKRPVVERFEDRILATVGLAATPTHSAEIQIAAAQYSVRIFNPFPEARSFLLNTKAGSTFETKEIAANSSKLFDGGRATFQFKLARNGSATPVQAGISASKAYTLTSSFPNIVPGTPTRSGAGGGGPTVTPTKQLTIKLDNQTESKATIPISFSSNGGSTYTIKKDVAFGRSNVATVTIPYTIRSHVYFSFSGKSGSGSELSSLATSFIIYGTKANPRLSP
jgi:hypothetical protein